MMHVASIQKGAGTIEELTKEIGAVEVDRLQQMKIIVSDGSDNNWKLSNIGWELVDLFNRKKWAKEGNIIRLNDTGGKWGNAVVDLGTQDLLGGKQPLT